MNPVKTSTAIFAAFVGLVDFQGAETTGRAEAQVTVQVTDDTGQPIPDIRIGASSFQRWKPGEGFGEDVYTTVRSATDRDGRVVLRTKSSRAQIALGSDAKPGYYGALTVRHRFTDVKDRRWQPWNPTISMVLKRVLNPIPLYARKINSAAPVKIPVMNEPVGFDLMVGDWVEPAGKGRASDLFFTLREILPYRDETSPFDYVLVVTFPRPGDGIQSVYSDPSELRVPHQAPGEGYGPSLERRMARSGYGQPMINDASQREDQNYFFRVRTLLDQEGRVQSALYGKVSGDFRFTVNRALIFTYYLNPTAQDRNLEFDPRRNLFTNLDGLEQVTAP